MVREFVALGPIPDSASVTEAQINLLGEALDRITPPITPEEAELLLTAFGPDECFGLAWNLLHIIEIAPGGAPICTEPSVDANEWVRDLWTRAHRGKSQGGRG